MSSSVKAEDIDININCKLTCDFEILRRAHIFAGADIEVIKLFAYLSKRKKISAGDQIITMGNNAKEAFYLISGSAEVTVLHHENEIILQQLQPGTFFGELALLARFKWFFHVRALTDCEAISISRESFFKVLEKYPDRREKMVEKIVQLRVERLVEQTSFMLDKLPDSLLSDLGRSSTHIPL